MNKSGRPRNERDRQRVEQCLWEGMSVRQISAATGVPASTVYDWCKGRLNPNGNKRFLLPEEVDQILFMLNRQHMSVKAVCRQLHIGEEVISRYVQLLPRRYTYACDVEVNCESRLASTTTNG